MKYGSAMDSLISNENRVFLSSSHSQCVNLTESGLQNAPLLRTKGTFMGKDIKPFLPILYNHVQCSYSSCFKYSR